MTVVRHEPAVGALSWPAARDLAARSARPLAPAAVPLADALGCRLAVPLRALVAVPGADVAAMDGYAVAGEAPWRVMGRVLAGGLSYERALRPGEAVEIATGAPVPPGAESVLPYERASGGPWIRGEVEPGRHIRRRGEDIPEGAVVLGAGTVVTPVVAGLAAGLGHDTLTVRPRPSVTVLVTGDEVVDHGLPGPGRVRDAIGPFLPGLIDWAGGRLASHSRLPDGAEPLRAALSALTPPRPEPASPRSEPSSPPRPETSSLTPYGAEPSSRSSLRSSSSLTPPRAEPSSRSPLHSSSAQHAGLRPSGEEPVPDGDLSREGRNAARLHPGEGDHRSCPEGGREDFGSRSGGCGDDLRSCSGECGDELESRPRGGGRDDLGSCSGGRREDPGLRPGGCGDDLGSCSGGRREDPGLRPGGCGDDLGSCPEGGREDFGVCSGEEGGRGSAGEGARVRGGGRAGAGRGSVAWPVDVVVVCGASSRGPADHLRPVLAGLRAEVLVDGVAVRPGHPQVLARLPGGPLVVGLPGNPFAALAAAVTLLVPVLASSRGVEVRRERGALAGEVRAHERDTRLVPVLRSGRGAIPVGHDRPGSLWGAALAGALAVVPPGWSGEQVELIELPPGG